MDICDSIRKYLDEYPDDQEYALDQAIEDCISRGIQVEFLRSQKAEVIKVSLYEFDFEKYLKMERNDAYEDGASDERKTIIAILQDIQNGLTAEEIAISHNRPIDYILQAMKTIKK